MQNTPHPNSLPEYREREKIALVAGSDSSRFRNRTGFSLIVIAVALASICSSAAGEEVVLRGQQWSVTVEPETLRVTGTPTGGPPLPVSAALARSGGVADLRHDDRQASWRLGDEPFQYEQAAIPGQSVRAKWLERGKKVVYSPGKMGR